MTDLVLDASLYANSSDFETDFDPTPDQVFNWVGSPLIVSSGEFRSGNPSSGLVVNADPADNDVFAEFTHSSTFDGDAHYLWVLDASGDGYAAKIGYTTRLYNVVAYAIGSQVEVYPSSTAPADGDVHRLSVVGTDLIVTKNAAEVVTITVASVPRKPGMLMQHENSSNTTISSFVAGSYGAEAPAINPTGTDTDLINGTSASVVFSGLTSDPASIEVVWDNGVDSAISSTQADFSLGTVTDGVATATVTATIGNLPYTDATYLTADYSYLVTCDDDSEITFDTLTFAPETGNSFITVASPVNDSTSILPSEALVDGQQLEWPDEVVISESNTATIDVLANGQFTIEWSGAAASFTFTLRFWDGAEWFDIATTINTAGEVVSGGGLTRVGLTRIGLATAGLTAVGL